MIEHWDQFYSRPDEAIATARRWLDHPDPYDQPRYVAAIARALNSDGSRFCIPSAANPNQDIYMLNSGVMKSMRWGLTLALMGDVYYEIYVGCPTKHHTRWWYDEFDGGDGIRRRGYLGQPLGAPLKLASGVYRRDFQNGVALNNSTGSNQTIALGATFKKLRGTQNPSLNNGAVVSSVTVPAKDGVILLRSDGSVVTSSPPSSTSPPTIGGTAREGSTLSASTGNWSGSTPMSFTYRWKRCNTSGSDCLAISGATARTHEAATADVGHTLRVTVLASNTAGSDSATSSPTGLVQPLGEPLPPPPENTALPVVSGEAAEGLTVSASTGLWTSSTPLKFQYRWHRCDPVAEGCARISGAASPDYPVSRADVGATLRATVISSNESGSNAATSPPTAEITASEYPLLTDFERVTDALCATCNLSVDGGRLEAMIAGGHDTLDTAYGVKDFGGQSGWSGRVYTRTVVHLPAGQALNGTLALFQVRDVNDALVYGLNVGPDRIIRLLSPPGGLSANAIDMSTGVALTEDGAPRQVEVAAVKNDSAAVRVDGVETSAVAGLAGATTANQRYMLAGIRRYDAASTSETVVARHGGLGVSRLGWLEGRGITSRVRLARRYRVRAERRLVLRVHAVPGSHIRAVVRGIGGRTLGVGTASVGGRGEARVRVKLRRWHGHRRVRVLVMARYRPGWEVSTAHTRRVIRLTARQRSRLWAG
jgi:hypothetical protein